MMKIKFLTLSAGPDGVIYPGDVIEVSDSEAKLLIDGGYADAAQESKPVESEIETEEKPKPRTARSKRK